MTRPSGGLVDPETKIGQDEADRFRQLFDRSNIKMLDLDIRIADKVREIRDYYRQLGVGPEVCKSDARHLATAIIYRADEFHTFDEHDNHGCRGLLGLSGNVAGHHLMICKPRTDQLGLL